MCLGSVLGVVGLDGKSKLSPVPRRGENDRREALNTACTESDADGLLIWTSPLFLRNSLAAPFVSVWRSMWWSAAYT